MRIFPIVLLIAVALAVTSCQSAPVRIAAQTQSAGHVAVKTPDQVIGIGPKEMEIPFELQAIPEQVRLLLDFRVVDKGHCLVTYEPTTVWINNRKIKEIDFRDFETLEHRRIMVDLPVAALRQGSNLVRLRTGECQYDIDAMKFNEIRLEMNEWTN